MQEIVESLAVDLDGEPTFDVEDRMPVPAEILRICSSLVTMVRVYRPSSNTLRPLGFLEVKT